MAVIWFACGFYHCWLDKVSYRHIKPPLGDQLSQVIQLACLPELHHTGEEKQDLAEELVELNFGRWIPCWP